MPAALPTSEWISAVIAVSVWDGRSVLLYAGDLIDELLIAQDALRSNAVPQKEIDRVLIPKCMS